MEFSNLTGLELAEIFNVSKDTITSINVGRTWRENREYPIRQFRIIKINNKLKGNKVTVNKRIKQNKNEKNKNHCIECGKEISYRAQRCGKCLGIFRRKATRPTKEELFNQLKLSKGNFTKVASSYNVTDNAIRKWCKSYNLPYHSSDYK